MLFSNFAPYNWFNFTFNLVKTLTILEYLTSLSYMLIVRKKSLRQAAHVIDLFYLLCICSRVSQFKQFN